MNYVFDENIEADIVDRILKLNNVSLNDLDVNGFIVDYKQEVLVNFSKCLLSRADKRFLIVGDYDCDGICATAIIKHLLDSLNIECNYYIPSRVKQGYGLSERIVNTAYENHFDCLFCVDNGIVADKALSLAASLNIEVFIIDHHEYQTAPMCVSYLHPNLFTEKYEDMCAAGLCGLLANSFKYDELNICLSGLATLADIVKVKNYNRYLLKQMLEIVKTDKIRPISLLLGDNPRDYLSLQFNVIPKINAVSRLDDLMNVNYVVRFLLSEGEDCLMYFDKIENINKQRKLLSKKMYDIASSCIYLDDKVMLVISDEFYEGLCGLLANKLMQEYKKPVLVLAKVGSLLKGSGRSPQGANLYEYLLGFKELFESYGGHQMAVGLSLNEDKLASLVDYIKNNDFKYEIVQETVLLVKQDQIDFSMLEKLESLRPYGNGFTEPLLAIKKPNIKQDFVVSRRFRKFILADKLNAISFNSKHLNVNFTYMIGHLQIDNYYNDKLSFVIEDLV